MENGAFTHSCETCDVFSEVVTLFLPGPFRELWEKGELGTAKMKYESPGVPHSRTQAGHGGPVHLRKGQPHPCCHPVDSKWA